MAEFQLAEILRTPLEELVLQIKILKLGFVRPFLQKAIEPPEDKSVQNALQCLRELVSMYRVSLQTTVSPLPIPSDPASECTDGQRRTDPTGTPLGQLTCQPTYWKDHPLWGYFLVS
jgi:hypothetical protein